MYAHENKYIFVGQNGDGECAKAAFFLEVSGDDLNKTFVLGENGEIYLKADKIISIPKHMFADFVCAMNFENKNLTEDFVSGRREPVEVRCPDCKQYYIPQPGKGCPNSNCPSNK